MPSTTGPSATTCCTGERDRKAVRLSPDAKYHAFQQVGRMRAPRRQPAHRGGPAADGFDTTDLFWQEEYRFRRADGTWAEVFDRGFLLRDAAGRAVRMIGAMQDITARKQAERHQQLLTEKLDRPECRLAGSLPTLCRTTYERRWPMRWVLVVCWPVWINCRRYLIRALKTCTPACGYSMTCLPM